jgi:hypothetical protein
MVVVALCESDCGASELRLSSGIVLFLFFSFLGHDQLRRAWGRLMWTVHHVFNIFSESPEPVLSNGGNGVA